MSRNDGGWLRCRRGVCHGKWQNSFFIVQMRVGTQILRHNNQILSQYLMLASKGQHYTEETEERHSLLSSCTMRQHTLTVANYRMPMISFKVLFNLSWSWYFLGLRHVVLLLSFACHYMEHSPPAPTSQDLPHMYILLLGSYIINILRAHIHRRFQFPSRLNSFILSLLALSFPTASL